MILSRTEERELHGRLLARDAAATTECCFHYIPAVHALLRRRYPGERYAHLLEEAIDTAVFNFVKRPEAYNPDLLPLAAYLRMAAHRDLQTLLKREQRRNLQIVPGDRVELVPDPRNILGEDESYELPAGLTAAQVFTELNRQIANPVDREVLRLMVIEDVRETARYVPVLGIGHLDKAAQELAVKRAKDRITKRLRRLGEKLRAGTAT